MLVVISVYEKYLDKSLKYVVGVSGGSDSMYLLDTLRRKGYQVIVAHVNYHYRHDSDVDYELVKNYCEKYEIPFYYREFHHEDFVSGNFQDKARELRYLFYKELYEKYKCSGVVLGHHLDDCLENIYMQLTMHHTVYYLGMKEVNVVMGMNIVRPLMDMYKEDILLKVKELGIPYHDDYTNFETDFKRDEVRNTVLNTYSKKDKEKLLEKARKHNLRIQDLEFKVKPYYQQYIEDKKIDYHLIDDDLMNIFLYKILSDVMEGRLISYSLIEEIKHQIHSLKPNIQMNLPVNYLFIKEYDNIYVSKSEEMNGYCYVFEKKMSFCCEYFQLSDEGHMNEGVYLSPDDYPIMIRTMQPGDFIETSSGTKKLSRLFINAKVPMIQRKTWPVVVNKDKTIVLVPHIAKNIDYLTTKPNVFVIK